MAYNHKNIIPVIVVLIVIVGIPFLVLNYQAKRSGLSRMEVIKRTIGKTDNAGEETTDLAANTIGVKIDFLDPLPIGEEFTEPPLIAHIQAVDLDDDNLLDVIVCDDRGNSVSWIRQDPAGTFTESVLASGLMAPAHVEVIDFDHDGDKDIMLGVLGMLFPNNDKILLLF